MVSYQTVMKNSSESGFCFGGDDKILCGGSVVSSKINGLLSHVIYPEGLVSPHLNPYHKICRNYVRTFRLHGMDYYRTPLGTTTTPFNSETSGMLS